jgi:hypothetical protein
MLQVRRDDGLALEPIDVDAGTKLDRHHLMTTLRPGVGRREYRDIPPPPSSRSIVRPAEHDWLVAQFHTAGRLRMTKS